MSLQIQEAAVDELRDGHRVLDPVSGQEILATALGGGFVNRVLHSEAFDEPEWSRVNGTITPNAIAGPEEFGTDADLFVEANDTAAEHEVFQLLTGSDGPPSFGIFCKPAGRDFVTLFARSNATPTDWTRLHVDLVSLNTALETSGGGGIVGDPYLIDLGGGWVRIGMQFVRVDNNPTDLEWGLFTGDAFQSITYDGDGSSGVYVFGAHQQNDRWLSFYEPTTTASVTRSGDSGADIDSLPSTGSLLGSSLYVRAVMQGYPEQSSGPQLIVSTAHPVAHLLDCRSRRARLTFWDSGGTRFILGSPDRPCESGDLVEAAARFQDNGAGVDMTMTAEFSVNHGATVQATMDVPRETDWGDTDSKVAPNKGDHSLIHAFVTDEFKTLEELRTMAGF